MLSYYKMKRTKYEHTLFEKVQRHTTKHSNKHKKTAY